MASGLIPQSFIEDLLDRVDIVDVINSRVKLKKSGKNYMGLCPFHNENTPSFSVNSDKQFFHCFGCGAGGDALKFVMDYEHLDFVPAVEELARVAGVEVPREESEQDRKRHQQQKSLHEVLKKSSDFFYNQLKHHPLRQQTVNYLRGRGLDGHIAKRFQIGFAPDGWNNLLKELGTDDELRALLLQGGMTIENDNGKVYDRFRNRVMFPIRDARGRTVGFGGRVLGDEKPKYLNSPETPVFQKSMELYGLYEAKQSNRKLERVIIVEGYMDVVSLAQFDIDYAVATLGTATSKTHLERLFKLVNDVVFCFDGDQAGRAAAWRALETVIPMLADGRQVRVLFLPDGEDPDTLVRKEGKEAFELRVREATPITEFLFSKAKEGINLDTLDGKAAYAQTLIQWISQIPASSMLRELMTKRLADITGLEQNTLITLENKLDKTQPPPKEELEPEESKIESGDPEDYQLPDTSTRIDLPALSARPKGTVLSPSAMITACVLRMPQLANQVKLNSDDNIIDSDRQLLVKVIELIEEADHPLTNQINCCSWMHHNGLKEVLNPIENSDYFWLGKELSTDDLKHRLTQEIQNNLDLINHKLPNEEYEHLKNRLAHHSSEVTKEEVERFNRLTLDRKLKGLKNIDSK